MNAAAGQITTISTTDQGFAIATLVLVVLALGSLITAHLLDRGVHPVRDAVSDFGAGAQPWPYRLTAVWSGLAALLVSVIMANAIFPRPTLTILLLLVFAGTRWAITIFPTDLEGEDATPVGRSHLVLAVAAFAAICAAAVSFLVASNADPVWEPRGLQLVVVGVMCVSAVWSAVERARDGRFFGLAERLLYLAFFAWLSLVSLYVLAA